MNRIPLDFVGRVVNLLLYNDYYKVDCDDVDPRERHVSAISGLSRPWPQFVTSLQDCHLYVSDNNVYSIHTMKSEHRNYHVTVCLSEVDILTWNRSRHVVAELSFGGATHCKCYPTCRRPLSPEVFRNLRNILRMNQRPVSVLYRYYEDRHGANLHQLLPSIRGIGLLEVWTSLRNSVPRLLQIPVNFFSITCCHGEDAWLVAHMVEAMKKGLLRGWQRRSAPIVHHEEQEKMFGSIMDLHSELPPKYFWYDRKMLFRDIKSKLQLVHEKWTPFLVPGYHSTHCDTKLLRYIC
uniref:Tudor domain-containing protein n=1 Tax=Steinernema glaseri TaxID=37863 RepID=A0A1I7ZLX1_9BILA